MTLQDKWRTAHWRRGCWVAEHTRTNGVRVRGHWRDGGRVKGHYSMTAMFPLTRALTPDMSEDSKSTPPRRVRVAPGDMSATLVMMIRSVGIGRPVRNSKAATAQARATAIAWRRGIETGVSENGQGIPEQVDQLTVHWTMEEGGALARYRTDTDVAVAPDGRVARTTNCQRSAREVYQALERWGDPHQTDNSPVKRHKQRNRTRAALGATDPEATVAEAMRDSLRMAPLPSMEISQAITIATQDGRYLLTIRANEEDEQRSSDQDRDAAVSTAA